MTEVLLGLSSHKRRTTWNPDLRVVNLLVEKTPTNQFNGIDHIQRPGEVLFHEFGGDPIQGIFRQAGTFNGDFLIGTGGVLFRLTSGSGETELGPLGGSSRFVAAASIVRAIIVADGVATSTDGTTTTNVIMPDSREVGSVAQLNGYFVLPELDSARFYWTAPGESDPDGLSYATTESSPGYILKVERVGDELWFFKQEGIEVWTPTGDPDLPFQRVPGRNYDKGARSKDAISRFDNSVAWVGNDGLAYRADSTPVRFSDHALEEQIRKSSPEALTAWSFSSDGHALWCLTLEQATYAYDASSQQWSQFKTYGQTTWRCHVGDMGDDFTLAGSSSNGDVYVLDGEASNDAGLFLERILTGGVAVVGQPVRCDSLDLYVSTGTAAASGVEAKARVSWSDDLQLYSDFEDVSLGERGQYGRPVRLNRLGYMRYPGRLFEIRITDDVVATISAAFINEPSR